MFGKKKSGGNGSAGTDGPCVVCKDKGGHWTRNSRTGEVTVVRCVRCGAPPKGTPPK